MTTFGLFLGTLAGWAVLDCALLFFFRRRKKNPKTCPHPDDEQFIVGHCGDAHRARARNPDGVFVAEGSVETLKIHCNACGHTRLESWFIEE